MMEKKNNKVILATLMIYIIIVYPLIYQIYADNGVIGNGNKLFLFFLLLIFVIHNYKYISFSRHNVLLVISLLYMVISLLLYAPNMSIQDILREVLYVFVPIILFFIFEHYPIDQQVFFLNVVIYSLLIVIMVGVLNLFGVVLPIPNMKVALTHSGVNFQSYYSSLEMGYVVQLLFAMTLMRVTNNSFLTKFRIPVLVVLFILGILTLQRGCYMGLLFGLFFYVIERAYSNNMTIKNSSWKTLLKLVLLMMILYVLLKSWYSIASFISELMGVDIKKFVLDEIHSFNLNDVVADRTEQAVISNTTNVFHLFFGEGFGKYSPNNTATIRKMPDASYYRIFDELGIIGFFLFFFPYLCMVVSAVRKRRFFTCYFILETFTAFFFNRILWMIPLNYFIYPIMSISMKKESCLYEILGG